MYKIKYYNKGKWFSSSEHVSIYGINDITDILYNTDKRLGSCIEGIKKHKERFGDNITYVIFDTRTGLIITVK